MELEIEVAPILKKEVGWTFVDKSRELRDRGEEGKALECLTIGRRLIEESREEENDEEESSVLDKGEGLYCHQR